MRGVIRALSLTLVAGCAADSDEVTCPDPPPELAACFQGTAHADCGGDGEPALLCRSTEDGPRCRWFDRGCGPAGWAACEDHAEDCRATSAFSGWGAVPWTRDRAMDLSLAIDPAVEGAAATLRCAGPCVAVGAPEEVALWGDRGCFHESLSLCEPPDPMEDEAAFEARQPRPDATERRLPGLVTIQIGQHTSFTSQVVVLELDFERGRARACLVTGSDTANRAEPVCAGAGEVVVAGTPAAVGDVAALHGRFDATFPPRQVFRDSELRVEGLRLTGTF